MKIAKFGNFLAIFILIAIIFNMAHPSIVHAEATGSKLYFFQGQIFPMDYLETENKFKNHLPKNGNKPARWSVYITVTAYSSTVGQCDDTPCITASGFNLCKHNKEDIIASNYLPIGAKVRFPELFGDKVFTVEDRMNSRYYKRVDIWMKKKEKALNFGVKNIKMEVL